MDKAVQYSTLIDAFAAKVRADATATVEIVPGRRFDRVLVTGDVRYFVDRHTWEIWGPKSSFQYNPRRLYGSLETINEWNWAGSPPSPVPGTAAEQAHNARELALQQNYKPRGRPRKVKSV